jgi:hypothetical protein
MWRGEGGREGERVRERIRNKEREGNWRGGGCGEKEREIGIERGWEREIYI